ncbi:aminotransferase class V-fold PLP-dependent enzyme [Brucella grignonensis]|uniref:Cys/Met metabolism PLP-dependent enzyme family protein n=1 Tax=Brucella grignonensis TaxID=94627 RepID=A0A256G337_9HYPH|nr:aminotransferase class V-fold PLP-dependent enzyme [Brucella grignonensis]OYR21489.1 cys/Met metabolism PLP-dependent enzyme family protein [Brucella grignonensis]
MISDQKISELRRDIPYLNGRIYVDNAAVSPISGRVRDASDQYNAIIAAHLREAKQLSRPYFEKGRMLAAKLIGSSPDHIAYVQNTSHGLSLVALGIDWRAGDNVVVCAQEFPSNYLCWLQLESLGVEIRKISATDGKLQPDVVRQALDDRTRVVTVSHVQFYSGYRVDVASLGELCRENGALLVVDGTQSIGAIELDVTAAGIDVLVTSAHKWMMGPRGIGFASFSNRALDQVTPRVTGWLSVNDPFDFNRTLDFLPDARRFEPGTPDGCGIFGLTERLSQIDELGIKAIETRILMLHAILRDRAQENGIEVCYQFDEKSSSGITLLQKPGVAATDLLAVLAENDVYASIRNGAIRISAHYYNTTDEIEQIISILGFQ